MFFDVFNLVDEKEFEEILKEIKSETKENDFTKEELDKLNLFIKKLKEEYRYILGFGRGYFAGDKEWKFLIEKENEFYFIWHLSDEDYPLILKLKKQSEYILKLLEENKMESCINDLRNFFDKSDFWDKKENQYFEKISFEKFFDCDKEEIYLYVLDNYKPRTSGTEYPHKYFDQNFHKDKKIKELKKIIDKAKISKNNLYIENENLFIKINGKRYLLIEQHD